MTVALFIIGYLALGFAITLALRVYYCRELTDVAEEIPLLMTVFWLLLVPLVVIVVYASKGLNIVLNLLENKIGELRRRKRIDER